MKQEIVLRLTPKDAYDEASIAAYLRRERGLRVTAVRVKRRSIDARQRNVFVGVTAEVYVGEQPDALPYVPVRYRSVEQCPQAVVVGAGPGGLFAALRLIELGIRPIIVERGKDVRTRKKDLARIRTEQAVDSESNYAFGEGGAGAYSDGKLYTRAARRGATDRKSCTSLCSMALRLPSFRMRIPTSAPTVCRGSSRTCATRFSTVVEKCISVCAWKGWWWPAVR